MAWAEKLPSGKYRGVYRDAFGAKRPVRGTFSHKPKAKRAAATQEDKARKSVRRDPEAYRRSWNEWCEEWWQSRSVAPSTLKADSARRRNHLEPRWGNVPIGAISRHEVKEWAADLRRGGMGPETIKRCVHLLSASLTAAVDQEIIDLNPASRIKLSGGALAQERYLTKDEYATLRSFLPTVRDQLVADMLVYTGLRWGELAGLHWSRVDLGRGVLRVVETWDEVDGTMRAYPKGKRTRDVPIRPELVEVLKELPHVGHDCGKPHATGRCQGPLVLTTEEGTPLRNSNWSYRAWVPSVEAAGIGHVRVHDCRHSYASWLLQDGIPLAEVGKLLGHVSTQTSARYAHLEETPSAAVFAALGAPRLPPDRVG